MTKQTPTDQRPKSKDVKPKCHRRGCRDYYLEIGWDEVTRKPLPDTLKRFGLEHVIKDP